jgi:putative sigma-54 modulation protein
LARVSLYVEKLKEKLDFWARQIHLKNMKLILSSHNLTPTKAIVDHVEKCIQKLDHFDPKAIDARVTLEHDHSRAPEKQFTCSIRLAVHGPDLFAKDVESDLYAAIDLVTKKIEQQIRKQHSRYKTYKHKDAAKLKSARRAAGV